VCKKAWSPVVPLLGGLFVYIMKKNTNKIVTQLSAILLAGVFVSCDSALNTNYDSHFTEDGYLIADSTFNVQTDDSLKSVSFYTEVSGSMNGFFRNNMPNRFKKDVWQILNHYAQLNSTVTTLTNDGSSGAVVPYGQFQMMMNAGAFVSTASTKIPVMINSIMSELDAKGQDVAVLISDMKYSPVGAAAPAALLQQYSTDISRIFAKYNYAVSLVCATSEYFDKNGNIACDISPYYYLIVGKNAQVIKMRNDISAMLQMNGSFVDNIDTGVNFDNTSYSFGISNRCDQLESEPTFKSYEEVEDGDTCKINLKVDISKYRWIVANKDYFAKAFNAKSIYGSDVQVGKINITEENITDRKIQRVAIAEVELKVFNMATESDVIEWVVTLPESDYTLFLPFCGAISEDDITKTYSLENFLKGMFCGGILNTKPKPNYILVSKNNTSVKKNKHYAAFNSKSSKPA